MIRFCPTLDHKHINIIDPLHLILIFVEDHKQHLSRTKENIFNNFVPLNNSILLQKENNILT